VRSVKAEFSSPSTTRRQPAWNAPRWERSCADNSGATWRSRRLASSGEQLKMTFVRAFAELSLIHI